MLLSDITLGVMIFPALKSEFSFLLTGCYTNAKEPSQLYYLPKAGGRFIPFSRVLAQCENANKPGQYDTMVVTNNRCDAITCTVLNVILWMYSIIW